MRSEGTSVSRETIEREAFHRRFMFLSESISFVLLTCLGLYLLYQALKAEARSREIQRNFIEIVSHESKTPITALKLRLEGAMERFRAQKELTAELGLCLDELRRLSSTFEKVMSLSRVERQALKLEVLDLGDLIRSLICRLEPFFRAKEVEVSTDLGTEALIKGDAHALQNSVQSLLENAVIYNNNHQKKVRVSLQKTDSKVWLSVLDNGSGIDPADRPFIFERFYRGMRQRQIPGTGLGLSIAKTIIEAHQGTIRLAETREKGSHFEVELPAEA